MKQHPPPRHSLLVCSGCARRNSAFRGYTRLVRRADRVPEVVCRSHPSPQTPLAMYRFSLSHTRMILSASGSARGQVPQAADCIPKFPPSPNLSNASFPAEAAPGLGNTVKHFPTLGKQGFCPRQVGILPVNVIGTNTCTRVPEYAGHY